VLGFGSSKSVSRNDVQLLSCDLQFLARGHEPQYVPREGKKLIGVWAMSGGVKYDLCPMMYEAAEAIGELIKMGVTLARVCNLVCKSDTVSRWPMFYLRREGEKKKNKKHYKIDFSNSTYLTRGSPVPSDCDSFGLVMGVECLEDKSAEMVKKIAGLNSIILSCAQRVRCQLVLTKLAYVEVLPKEEYVGMEYFGTRGESSELQINEVKGCRVIELAEGPNGGYCINSSFPIPSLSRAAQIVVLCRLLIHSSLNVPSGIARGLLDMQSVSTDTFLGIEIRRIARRHYGAVALTPCNTPVPAFVGMVFDKVLADRASIEFYSEFVTLPMKPHSIALPEQKHHEQLIWQEGRSVFYAIPFVPITVTPTVWTDFETLNQKIGFVAYEEFKDCVVFTITGGKISNVSRKRIAMDGVVSPDALCDCVDGVSRMRGDAISEYMAKLVREWAQREEKDLTGKGGKFEGKPFCLIRRGDIKSGGALFVLEGGTVSLTRPSRLADQINLSILMGEYADFDPLIRMIKDISKTQKFFEGQVAFERPVTPKVSITNGGYAGRSTDAILQRLADNEQRLEIMESNWNLERSTIEDALMRWKTKRERGALKQLVDRGYRESALEKMFPNDEMMEEKKGEELPGMCYLFLGSEPEAGVKRTLVKYAHLALACVDGMVKVKGGGIIHGVPDTMGLSLYWEGIGKSASGVAASWRFNPRRQMNEVCRKYRMKMPEVTMDMMKGGVATWSLRHRFFTFDGITVECSVMKKVAEDLLFAKAFERGFHCTFKCPEGQSPPSLKIVVLESRGSFSSKMRDFLEGELWGIDLEWEANTMLLVSIQVSNSEKTFIWRVDEHGVPQCLVDLLEDKNRLKCGFDTVNDRLLLASQGINVKGLVDVAEFQDRYCLEGAGLQMMAQVVCDLRITKEVGKSASFLRDREWSDSDLIYLAEDAYASLRIAEALIQECPRVVFTAMNESRIAQRETPEDYVYIGAPIMGETYLSMLAAEVESRIMPVSSVVMGDIWRGVKKFEWRKGPEGVFGPWIGKKILFLSELHIVEATIMESVHFSGVADMVSKTKVLKELDPWSPERCTLAYTIANSLRMPSLSDLMALPDGINRIEIRIERKFALNVTGEGAVALAKRVFTAPQVMLKEWRGVVT